MRCWAPLTRFDDSFPRGWGVQKNEAPPAKIVAPDRQGPNLLACFGSRRQSDRGRTTGWPNRFFEKHTVLKRYFIQGVGLRRSHAQRPSPALPA